MDESRLKRIIEALLFSSDKPLTLSAIKATFDEWNRPEDSEMIQALEALASDYDKHAFGLYLLARGYVIRTKEQYSEWIIRLQSEKPAKYSRALLETLAIIAYKQPVTRGDIEEIRGVAVNSQIMRTLMEREWIKVAGHKDVPGKPAVYVTTKAFLDYFNLENIHQLPRVPESDEPLTLPE